MIEAKDNWNYTRGLLFTWAIPFYHVGVRATLPVGERVTVDTGRERIEGTFADLDAEGALVICDRHGQRRTVTFGDVTLDAAAPQDGH